MTDNQRPKGLSAVRLAACLLLAGVALLSSCREPPPRPTVQRTVPAPVERVTLPRVASITSEPSVRVRIAAETSELAFEVDAASGPSVILGPTRVDGERSSEARLFHGPVRVSRADGQWVLRTGAGDYHWAVPWLRVEAGGGDPIRVEDTRYPGAVVLVPLSYRGRETGSFDAVNFVPIESYLPGVVEREMWPRWHDRAFEAQAIAARSYALFEQNLHRDRHYDLASTTASQVYGGEAENPRVVQAVRRTRGRVVTFEGHVLPTFYSSCCGGTSQSAAAAFPHFGAGVDLPPLRSAQRRAWCNEAGSNHYRWGPVQRDALTLSQRLRTWGEANDHAIARMAWLTRIEVAQRTPAGRPTAFTVTDNRGVRFTLAAEHFRFACNHPVEGLADVPFEQQLRSSHVQPYVSGRTVRFTDGRGFGHGVGMCQWCAQGMAKNGRSADAILREAYPGAQVQRAY